MSKSSIVNTPEGSYERASSRLPKFLKAFPIDDGYTIETTILDGLDFKPGLKELYIAAINAGRNIEDCGLPPLPSMQLFGFKAVLKKDGNIVSSSHAMTMIVDNFDVSRCETNARQRLMAACGFGGEILDSDEENHLPRDIFQSEHVETEPPVTTSGNEISTSNLSNTQSHSQKESQVSTPVDKRPLPNDIGIDTCQLHNSSNNTSEEHETISFDVNSDSDLNAKEEDEVTGVPDNIKSAVKEKLHELRNNGVEVKAPSSKREALAVLRMKSNNLMSASAS